MNDNRTAIAGTLALAHGLSFPDLYDRDGLAKLDAQFIASLRQADGALCELLLSGRAAPQTLSAKDEGNLLIALAPHLDAFIVALFGIAQEATALRQSHARLNPLSEVKRLFVQRRAVKDFGAATAMAFDGPALTSALEKRIGGKFTELTFAEAVAQWLNDEAANAEALDLAARYAAWAVHSDAGRGRHGAGVLFKVPRKVDHEHLVPVEATSVNGVPAVGLAPGHWRHREGFALTDPGMDLTHALDQANYCIWCHNQGKDSCSKGLTEKSGAFRKSPLGVTLAGCPLEEKISEMHVAKAAGDAIGALAIIAVDNPLAAATGHRICNDCMKSCIFQKQEPVDIPQAETRTLKDVLDLPWGFEIYSLLTRWNPLNLRRPLPLPASGRSVLVVGLGPAGFSLAHHLLNDGHHVAAIDGLKIEPLPESVSGVKPNGERVSFAPIRDIASLNESLDDRVMAGFGGVAEYGITVRWDKNFLKIIRLMLERRAAFAMFGGIRFGGTVTVESAFAMGFDHIALCAGAGKPTVIDIPNRLARGVRAASDFLMALQLTGAAKAASIANLQIRLPVVVVGGGLTAIDTATESIAYYPRQVEKFLSRYEILAAERGEATLRQGWTEEDREIGEEFILHARALRAEREAATRESRAAAFLPLLESWGGVTIAYRRKLIEAPSYTLNHEEVHKAMEEGVRFAEGLTPVAIDTDSRGYAAAMRFTGADGAEAVLPARSILVAAGTQPNTVLAREDPDHLELDGRFFRALDEAGNPVKPERLAKPGAVHVLTHLAPDGRAVSFFGDLHPSFSGNVVKAMGGAKQGYPLVSRMLGRVAPRRSDPTALLATLNDELRARVHEVVRLTPNIVEVVVKAPAAAREFRPGQFYRLQNYETLALTVDGTTLAMEGLALTGAWVDRAKGLVSVIVLEMGGSSDLCTWLKPGEPVVLMGPTGTPTETPGGESAILVGGGLGNAVLFSIGQALRSAGSRVVYFAGYKRGIDRYKVEQIEAAADIVVWCCDEAPGFQPTRTQDRAFVGNIVDAMLAYTTGRLGPAQIPLSGAQRMIAIGSDGMMAAVTRARHGVLAPHLKPGHIGIASINSPMQCMMKEICAQCLQPHRDPVTGEETVVFSCFNQDQLMDEVDFAALRQRLGQNKVQEKLTRAWIDRCLRRLNLRKAA